MQLVRLLFCALAAFAADVDGKWVATVSTSNGDFQVTYSLKADGETLKGTASSQMGETDLKEGKINGNEVSWVMIMERQGNQLRIVHKGTISGNEMKLKVVPEGAEDRTMEFVAKKGN
ncbi:MAG: hypothetical protein FJW30_00965 [Acidobacteria bacterium]|nr:hypothetical protein [Acidobacteriota bacterium]